MGDIVMATKYGDCRIDLREYIELIFSVLTQLDNIIAADEYSAIAGGSIHNVAVNNAKALKNILNTRGLQNAKHIVYISENDFLILEMYNHYNQQRPLVKQALTYDGTMRIIQSMQLIKCHKLLDKLHMSVLQLWDILHGYKSHSDDIYALLGSCGVEVCQKYLVYPLPDTCFKLDRPAYKSKVERNLAIIQMYLDGAGLRQLENAGFGIKRAAILSVLQQSGVYKGAEEGKVRHESGMWRTSSYPKYDSTAIKASKISNSKCSSSKRQRKELYKLRRNSTLTQQQIADLLGCSKAYYCNVENGRETPSEVFWNKISTLYGLETSDINEVSKISTLRNIKGKTAPEIASTNDLENNYDSNRSRYGRAALDSGYEAPI